MIAQKNYIVSSIFDICEFEFRKYYKREMHAYHFIKNFLLSDNFYI